MSAVARPAWRLLGLCALLALGAGCLSTDNDDADQGGGGAPGGAGDDDDATSQMDTDPAPESTRPDQTDSGNS